MNLCITINLKQKLIKSNNLGSFYFIEDRIGAHNFFEIIEEAKATRVLNVIVEEKCMIERKDYSSFVTKLNEIKIKVVVIGFDKSNINRNYYNFYVDLNNLEYTDQLSDILKIDFNDIFLKKSEDEDIIPYGKDVILSISLDRKVYATTYLIILCLELMKYRKVGFYEKDQSIISLESIANFSKNNIKYKKFSIINNSLFDFEGMKVIDLGLITSIKEIRKVLQNSYGNILVFITDCLRVNENDEYIKIIRILEKYNNITFINRGDIFDRKIQDAIKYDSKKISRNIKKNKLLEERDV